MLLVIIQLINFAVCHCQFYFTVLLKIISLKVIVNMKLQPVRDEDIFGLAYIIGWMKLSVGSDRSFVKT